MFATPPKQCFSRRRRDAVLATLASTATLAHVVRNSSATSIATLMLTPKEAEVRAIAAKAKLHAGSVFADVGANEGGWALEYLKFVEPGGRGYVTEIPHKLPALRELASQLGGNRLTVGSIPSAHRGLPDDGSIDAIVLRMVFHYEDAPVAAAASYLRALKPGGRLLIMEHPFCDWAAVDNEHPSLATLKQRNPFGYFNPLGRGHGLAWPPLRRMIEAVGFRVAEHGNWSDWGFCSYYGLFVKPSA